MMSLRVNTHRATIFIFLFFLIVLPFNNGFTINIGFPLKLQEITLGILLLLLIYNLYQAKSINPIPSLYTKIFFIFASLILLSFVNGMINFSVGSSNYYLARITPIIDSALKTIYILLAISVFIISRHFLDKKLDLIKYYFIGTWIASIISIFFLLCGILDIKVLNFFGMYHQYINLGITSFIRNGTFLEGNFLGLYFLISFILANHFNQRFLMWILPIAVVSTFSTIAIFTIFLYIFLISYKEYQNLFYALFLCILLVMINYITNGIFLKEQFFDKIPFSVAQPIVQPIALSTIERSEMIKTGFQMFELNPLFGVGPANYKYYFIKLQNKNTPESMTKQTRPMIANNVYIELLAEYGIFVFFTFLVFTWKLFWNVYNQKLHYLSNGLLVVLIYFMAFPSFSVFFLWVFFAILSLERSQYADY